MSVTQLKSGRFCFWANLQVCMITSVDKLEASTQVFHVTPDIEQPDLTRWLESQTIDSLAQQRKPAPAPLKETKQIVHIICKLFPREMQVQ